MKIRLKFISLLIALLLGILVFVPAVAGGWATITLDELPGKITAGETVEIGFTVRQHGVNPMADLTPKVIATQIETSETLNVAAEARGKTGHYIAELTFPQPGPWEWSIQAFTMDQPMPSLTVASAPVEVRQSAPVQIASIWVIGLGLLAAVVALLLFTRKRIRWGVALLIFALFFTGGGIALAAGQPQEKIVATVSDRPITEKGEALFIAKGCIICHAHTDVAAKLEPSQGPIRPAVKAPNLSQYEGSPEFLRLWLENPAAVKPDTLMPNLGLSGEEIEALIAFLVKGDTESSTNNSLAVPPENCRVTQPSDPSFIPPAPYPPETVTDGEFWYGMDDLWTMLPINGTWSGLPFHSGPDSHYVNKVFWWNKNYDWQSEPEPAFRVTARKLDNPDLKFETSEATNAYTPEFGSAILTGVEIPTPGCWELTGRYRSHELTFVVWVTP
jgi:cytochrome c2